MPRSGAPIDLVHGLARALREQVAPQLGAHDGRAHAGAGAGGDITFAIDERAEAFAEEFVARSSQPVALYSEDRGLVEPTAAAEWVLVVDPIDGTRPAMAGFESACVSVAAAPLEGDPRIGDVVAGCVVEIKSGRELSAVRGGGVAPAPRLSGTTDVGRMFWAYGLRGRPARAIVEVLGELLDASSVGGGTFDLGSAAYDMTRIVTGQLDAYVEPGPRVVAEVPGMRESFERVGRGAILNNSPYDVAAALLCLEEGGAVVSDAAGRPLADRPLLGSGPDYQVSCVAAASPQLHGAILEHVERGVERLRRRVEVAS